MRVCSAENPRAAADSLLASAELYLRNRQVIDALAKFNGAESAGASADRCAGGRWFCWMLLAQWDRAWQEADRIRARGAPDPHRYWDGSAFEGKRVLIRCLHGYGDAVQYLRYAPLIRAHAQRLMVQVAPAFVRLSECFTGIDQVITWGENASPEPEWDIQIEVAELPYIFRSTPENLPEPAPRLTLSQDIIRAAQASIAASPKPKVGLVWTGGAWDLSRSIPFAELSPLMNSDAADFWSLQAASDNSEWYRHCVERGEPIRVGGEHRIEEMAAFAAEMDLVITIDSLAAHVAATLGRPTWVMLRQAADWRWMLDRSDTPWYPTVRLFRQSREGDWSSVIDEVRRELAAWCSTRRPAPIKREQITLAQVAP